MNSPVPARDTQTQHNMASRTLTVDRGEITVRMKEIPPHYGRISRSNIDEPVVVIPYYDPQRSNIKYLAAALPHGSSRRIEVCCFDHIKSTHLLALTFFRAFWLPSKSPTSIDSIGVVTRLLEKGWNTETLALFSARTKKQIDLLRTLSRTLSRDLKAALIQSAYDHSFVTLKEIAYYPKDSQMELWRYIQNQGLDEAHFYPFLLRLRDHTGIKVVQGGRKATCPNEIVFPSREVTRDILADISRKQAHSSPIT